MHALTSIIVLPALALIGGTAPAAPLADGPNPSHNTTPAAQPAVFSADALAHQARALTGKFATTLQAALLDSLKTGGDSAAVAFCHDAAPRIAERFEQESGWSIGRTSVRVRNPNNRPDAWERGVLAWFGHRYSGGAPFPALQHDEIVATDDAPVYRYMKAIPTKPVCIRCHGVDIDQDTDRIIRTFYPLDQARGFSIGEIRGAFTLERSLQ